EAQAFLRSGTLAFSSEDDTGSIRTLLLMSDGCCFPRPDPSGPPDWRRLAGMYATGGLAAVVSAIRDLEAADPSRSHYPRFKIHDDIAVIAVEVRPSRRLSPKQT